MLLCQQRDYVHYSTNPQSIAVAKYSIYLRMSYLCSSLSNRRTCEAAILILKTKKNILLFLRCLRTCSFWNRNVSQRFLPVTRLPTEPGSRFSVLLLISADKRVIDNTEKGKLTLNLLKCNYDIKIKISQLSGSWERGWKHHTSHHIFVIYNCKHASC